jgi:hypothetical protein
MLSLFVLTDAPSDFTGLQLDLTLPSRSGLVVPDSEPAICNGKNPRWTNQSCNSTVVSKEQIRCQCSAVLEVAVALGLAPTNATPSRTSTQLFDDVGEALSSISYVTPERVLVVFCLLGCCLLGILCIFVMRGRLPKRVDGGAAASAMSADERRVLEQQYSELSERREFDFGIESGAESDDDKRDFSIRLEDEEASTNEPQQQKTSPPNTYDAEAATLPALRTITNGSVSRPTSSMFQSNSRRASRPPAMGSDYQPPSTKVSAATPTSAATLSRNLSSARKLTQ